jgi:hypothetical protein
MNLQQLLTYRTACLVHDLPMNLYIASPLSYRGISCQQTNNGISVWKKGNKPLAGAHFNFNGELSIKKNQTILNNWLRSQIYVWMMCHKCYDTPNTYVDTVDITLDNVKNCVHFYIF